MEWYFFEMAKGERGGETLNWVCSGFAMENILKIVLFKSCCEYKPFICFSEILSLFRFLRQRMDSDQLAIARLHVFYFRFLTEWKKAGAGLWIRELKMMTERL